MGEGGYKGMSREIKYAIKLTANGEYLRDDWDTSDAYTDDLSRAVLFDDVEKAAQELTTTSEQVVPIEIDEEGGMLEVSL
jgi:hypothetical protein